MSDEEMRRDDERADRDRGYDDEMDVDMDGESVRACVHARNDNVAESQLHASRTRQTRAFNARDEGSTSAVHRQQRLMASGRKTLTASMRTRRRIRVL